MKILFLLLMPILAFAHGGAVDKQGGHGHFNRKDNAYHCHKESCFSIHKQAEEGFRQADPRTYSKVYNRKDWPHWIDADDDCQNTRQELLITTSNTPVQFKNNKRCTVTYGQWYGVYTGKTFTNASDLDIDQVVPLAHAGDMTLINGHVSNVEPLQMTLIIFWLWTIQSISPNQIKRRMNGYPRIKAIGVSMASGGRVLRINTDCVIVTKNASH